MVLQPSVNASPLRCDLLLRNTSFLLTVSQRPFLSPCPCADAAPVCGRRIGIVKDVKWALLRAQACNIGGNPEPNFNAAAGKGTKNIVLKRFLNEEALKCSSLSVNVDNYSSNFVEDPIVDKLRNQLGVIHPLPSPPMNRKTLGLFALFFFVGVVFDKLWVTKKRSSIISDRPLVPSSLSLLLEKDLQRKESVEWVNMVLGKLWKVYRGRIENWITGLLQPVIDNLKKPDYVRRVVIKQFSLGDEPLSVRSVERRTSRRANDLQYQISLRYTGDARMLLLLSLKFSALPIAVPVGVRDFDIDGELWVKLRLIPMEPWVGAVSWAFVSLPKIKFELSPFRLFNLMAIPVLSMFLTKLLTEDLPKLFVRPKKIVLDFHKGKASGPFPDDLKSGEIQEGNKNFVGELSLTLLDARKLKYLFYGRTDPYVILRLGDQVIQSKKNSQTTVIGPPGEPIWNQDFHMLVADYRKEKLHIEVRDSVGFMNLTVGNGEVDVSSLKDTVPADRVVPLRGGWDLFGNVSAGEIILRLTYKAYVEDEEDEGFEKASGNGDMSEDEVSDTKDLDARSGQQPMNTKEESLVEVLTKLLVSDEFRDIMTMDATVDNPIKSSSSKSDGDGVQVSSQGVALLWLAVATSITLVIALNIDYNSSLFNP